MSSLTSKLRRAWWAGLAAIMLLSLAPGSERPENALGLPGQYEHLLAYFALRTSIRPVASENNDSRRFPRPACLGMDDEIAGVQVYGSDIFQQQGVIAIERDQRIATLLGFGRKSRG